MKPVVLPQLRLRRFWFGTGLLIALLATIAFLLPGRNLPDTGISDKTVHVLVFGMLAFWFGSIMVRRDLIWLLLALVAFGGLIEVAQGLMHLGRHADLSDLLADSIGVLLGLGLALTPLGRWPGWMEALLRRTAL